MDLRNHELSLCNKRRRRTLLFSLWEPLWKPLNMKGWFLMPFVDITYTSVKKIVCSLYVFKTWKRSSTWFIPASLCEGPFFYFYVESVFLLLSVSEANTCVKFVCNNFYMLVYCTYYISLCWKYPWDIYLESWKQVLKLKSSYVLIDAFYLESIALWVNSYAKHFDVSWKYIHESFCSYDSVVYSLSIC